jgi:hypothetical protein
MDSIEQEQARRKIYQAMIEQAMQSSDPYTVVSGRVVPNPMAGVSKMFQAYMGRKGLDESDAREKASGEASDAAFRDAASGAVPFKADTFDETDVLPEGLRTTGLSQEDAFTNLASNPNYRGREALQKALLEKQLGLNTSGNQYYTTEVDDQGRMWQIPGRGGKPIPLIGADGKQMVRGSSSATLQADITGAKERERQAALISAEAEKARQQKLGEGAGVKATADIMADAAGKKSAAETAAKIQAETGTKAAISGDKFDAYYNEALTLLSQNPTESGLGAAFDAAGSFVGYSPKGAATQDSLKVVAGNLTGLVPRFEGPQSDRDTALYKEMAAEVGANKPVERRIAALKTMKRLMDENIKNNTFKGFKDAGGTEKKRLKYNRETGAFE